MQKIVRRFDIDFKPLSVVCNITMPSGEGALQGYNAITSDYEPDRSIVPLVLVPTVTADGSNCNASLAEMHWYKVAGGTRTELVCVGDDHGAGSHTSTAGFAIDTSSTTEKGKLTITANTPVDTAWTMEFWGRLLDPRGSGQIYEARAAVTIRCVASVSADAYELTLSAPATNAYNPLRDADKQRVTASLTANGQAVAGATYLWEVPDGNSWRTAGTDVLDYWISASGDYCVVNRKLMGYEGSVRCTAQKSGVAVIDNVTRKVVTFKRRIPKLDLAIGQCPYKVGQSQKSIAPTIVAMDSRGEVLNVGEHFSVKWFVATNASNGVPAFSTTPTAYGTNPTLPATAAAAAYGGSVGVEVDDLGPLAAWVDSDGKVLTEVNAEGKEVILLIK